MIRELGRIIITLVLLGLAALLLSWGVKSLEAGQALGLGSLAGIIIGAVVTYWLKA